MRNEIILNNKSSKEIKGLLIQELPPISKPMIRTTVEEIDGRDGDIITKLGYSAYNKQISIGLHGDFDINEVIKYFDSEGVVTFSNEPDKYYKYQIVDQIDFERLIRFRTANITMHCQPFKYSTTEEPEEFEIGQTTGEGSEIELRPSAASKITLNAVKGDTEQQASPTPDSPQEVKTVTGEQTITISNGQGQSQNYSVNLGKNLFDKDNASTGALYVNGATMKLATNADLASIWIPCFGGETYTIQKLNTGTNQRFRVWTTADSPAEGVGVLSVNATDGTYDNDASYTVTTPSNAHYLGVLFAVSSTTPSVSDIEDSIQIEKGSTATTYASYFTPIELCKIGTYQDYIYKSGDDWYVHKETDMAILDGTENWEAYGNIDQGIKWDNSTVSTLSYQSNETPQLYSNYFIGVARQDIFGKEVSFGISVNTTSVFLRIYNLSSLSDYTSWLVSNSPCLYYILATPTDTQITNDTLIEELEAIYNANSYDEVTHVKSSSENKPMILNISVLSSNSCEVTNEGNIYSKPLLTIYGSGTINLSLNNEQMFVIDLGEEDNYVTIDTNAMEAYKDTVDNLMNRSVDGDYNNFKLNIGTNTLSWSGDLTKIVIDNYSRWI